MTSTDVADALLGKLNFYAAQPVRSDAPVEFAFGRDFDATMVWPDVAFDTASPRAHYPVEARPEVQSVIDAVGCLLGTRAPKALAFINRYMQRALVCRTDAIGGAFSASNRELVGYCLLANMHLPADRVLVCTEALLHESMHQYLYTTEMESGNFCDLSEGRTYRSPWSGNRIPLHSLIHAALVWYGLLTLWCQLAQSPVDADEAALIQDKVATVLFGFSFIRDMLASPSFPIASVQPQVVSLIERMAQIAADTAVPDDGRSTLRAALQASEAGAWLPRLANGLRTHDGAQA